MPHPLYSFQFRNQSYQPLTKGYVITWLLIVLMAFSLRLWDLDFRFIHYDESIHGYFSWLLSEGQGFRHNPLMHGPLQFILNAGSFIILGSNETSLRLPAAIFGACLVALPILMRTLIGSYGSLIASSILAISPTLLYFSRFARADIILAFLTLAIVITIWRYFRKQQARNIYIISALLALALATKESSFVHLAIIGGFILALSREDIERCIQRKQSLTNLSPPGVILLLIGGLTLPHWVPALAYIIQGPLQLILVNDLKELGQIGMPLGATVFQMAGQPITTGGVISTLLVMVFGIIGFSLLVSWNKRQALVAFAIFYAIWLSLFTTFFTNFDGVATGFWQSMGYWIVQHNEARISQPWYYYLTIASVYEFLPLVFSVFAIIYYSKKKESFTWFLIYWTVMAFVIYSILGEKAPWLVIHIALPMILLSSRFLGHILDSSIKICSSLFRLGQNRKDVRSIGHLTLFLAVIIFAGLLGAVTLRAGIRVSYENKGVPNEILVYAQIYPQVGQFVSNVIAKKEDSAAGKTNIAVDRKGAFDWPMYWLLRDLGHYGFSCSAGATCFPPTEDIDFDLILLHSENNLVFSLDPRSKAYSSKRIPYIGWFPETYRVTSFENLFNMFKNGNTWSAIADYWLYRELKTPGVKQDAYLYYIEDTYKLDLTDE